jgi:hypothetical protein
MQCKAPKVGSTLTSNLLDSLKLVMLVEMFEKMQREILGPKKGGV